ncbi:MAG: hypothetical protein DKM50_04315 [Candidatus Margulisiibacteriota bacterium]|nr:MAG: hypothetical protein DKM50_04315 [Candidatus Margulisiibacteriota bacterium]
MPLSVNIENIILSIQQWLLTTYNAKELTTDEIIKFSKTYKYGWKFDILIGEYKYNLALLIDQEFPFSIPRIAITNHDLFLRWPHIEENGLVCLTEPNISIRHDSHVELIQELIERLIALINESVLGTNQEDFIDEFRSYWGKWRKDELQEVLYIGAPPSNASTYLFYYERKDILILSDSEKQLKRWIKDALNKTIDSLDQIKKTVLIFLSKPLYPHMYPINSKEMTDLVNEHGLNEKIFQHPAAFNLRDAKTACDLLKQVVPKHKTRLPVVFGFNTANGSALGLVWYQEPVICRGNKVKYTRFNGFRNNKLTDVTRRRYIDSSEEILTSLVSPVNYDQIMLRSGEECKQISSKRVTILGVGSLGSHIAKLFVQAGIKNLYLIDNEAMNWGNTSRHILGGQEVSKSKAAALKRYLDRHFPGMLNIDISATKWQLITKELWTKVFSSDLILALIGNWNDDAALNYLFNTTECPPIVYGWVEPYSVAGHAIAILKKGGCLECGTDRYGTFDCQATQWDKKTELIEPACGISYQPYGIIDTLPVQSMINVNYDSCPTTIIFPVFEKKI